MQEKSINRFQQKLDALTELPDGFFFDVVQIWNRVEDKLKSKPAKKKRAVWYLAAASVMLLLLVVIFNNRSGNEVIAVKPTESKKVNSVTSINKNNDQVLGNTSNHLIKKVALSENKKVIQIKTPEAVEIDETKQEAFITQTEISDDVKIETVLPKTLTIVTAIEPVPVKRKIIHINELGKDLFFKEQQTLSVKEEKTSPEIITEQTNTSPKPWYNKFKSSHRTNNN